MTKLEVVRHTSEVSDADIERMLGNLQQQRASWSKIHLRRQGRRPGKPRDLQRDRRPAHAARGRGKRPAPCSARARCNPEVEQAIAGMQPGEEKTIDVTLPGDWHMPQFAGKTVTSTFVAGRAGAGAA